MRKVKISSQWIGTYHRSGWAYAISAIQHLHSDHGTLLDVFVEKKFVWDGDQGRPPYREPWIGFVHNPPYVPEWFADWFGSKCAIGDIMATSLWRESLPFCRGLFTLSNYLASWIRQRVAVPVCSLFHPTEPGAEQFSMNKYHNNQNRMIIHIGWWLRKFHSFHLLQPKSLRKLLLLPITQRYWRINQQKIESLLSTERMIAEQNLSRGSRIPDFKMELYKDNQSYDHLLSRNIVFMDLYDSSANNVIVECIIRNTPLVINPHPAIVEYLGKDYPLYFRTIEEASYLTEDDKHVQAAYDYLREHSEIKARLTKEHFSTEFINSIIYQQLL